jgi:two-component system response regulator
MNQPNQTEILLLVEDSQDDLDMTLRALRKANMANHIEIARDGVEALDFIFCEGAHAARKIENMPKLILLDLKLPKIDGMEVLKRIKGDPRTKMIPVVMLTSSKEQKDVIESYGLGTNSYIVKPVDFESFAEAVQKLGMYWLLLNQPPQTLTAAFYEHSHQHSDRRRFQGLRRVARANCATRDLTRSGSAWKPSRIFWPS